MLPRRRESFGAAALLAFARCAGLSLSILTLCWLFLLVPAWAQQELVSRNAAGTAATGRSSQPDVSSDGSATVFASVATDIVASDTDRISDIYLYLHASTGHALVTSVSRAEKANDDSERPSVSRDAERIVYETDATNLVTPDTNGARDVVLTEIDVVGALTHTLISATPAGRPGSGASSFARISADGEWVVFESLATNLVVGGGAVGIARIHIRDLSGGETTRLDPPTGDADGSSSASAVSGDGRYVVFETSATNFVLGDTNRVSDVILFDRETGFYRLISRGSGRVPGNGASGRPRISDDGRFVAFESVASNLVADDDNGVRDVFVHDVLAGTTERVSLASRELSLGVESSLADISADGRFVTFWTKARIGRLDTNREDDVHVFDRVLGSASLVSFVEGTGAGGDGPSREGAIDADGERISFESDATDINTQLGVDGNLSTDVYSNQRAPVDVEGGDPSNHVLVHVPRGELSASVAQYTLDGVLRTPSIPLRTGFKGLAIDEKNVVWVIDGVELRRFEAESLAPINSQLVLARLEESIFDIVAAGGNAWVADENEIAQHGPTGVLATYALGREVVDVSLTLDAVGNLWAGVVRTGDIHELVRLSRSLEQRHVFSRSFMSPAEPAPHLIRADSSGNILTLSTTDLAKYSPAGARLWTIALSRGDGLAIDGLDRAFVFMEDAVVGVTADGVRFLEVAHPGGFALERNVAVDGAGVVWAIVADATTRSTIRIDPNASPVTVDGVAGLDAGNQLDCDLAGFAVAHVGERDADPDVDGHLSGDETDALVNPFDPDSPDDAVLLPAVIDLVANVTGGGDSVSLQWDTQFAYPEYLILRDGARIPGNPFPEAAASDGVVDTTVPGGTHVYRVIGLAAGLLMAEGGGVGLEEDEDVEEPHSFSEEVSVTVGQGEIIACIDVFDAPDAVAYDEDNGLIAVAIAGGLIQIYDTDLQIQDELDLPNDPFSFTEIRGMTFDPNDPTALFLMLDDGQVFRREQDQDPVLLYTLPESQAEEGYTGMDVRDDIFFITSGPGAECFIGMQIQNGIFITQGNNLSDLLEEQIDHNAGVGVLPGGDLLFGVGVGGSTIDRVVGIEVSGVAPNFQFSNAQINVPLGGLESQDISDFAIATGIGLVVADRWNSRVCLLGAPNQLPPSPQIAQVTPGNGPWNGSREIEIVGANFGDNADDVQVRIDGVEAEIESFTGPGGPVRVIAQPLGRAEAVSISIQNSNGADVLDPGYVYGFKRGNSNDDLIVDLSDAIYTLLWLFGGGDDPACLDAVDSDDSGVIDITDATVVLDHLFKGQPPPPVPFLQFGLDPTDDDLDCTEN